tara:strand:+ start:291 stop:821 length:531 start_codon:yes stop_codon:yes gene_type:complete
MGLPYFWSAQLDGARLNGGEGEFEGWIGLIVFNFFVWVTIVVLDIHLLAFEFNDTKSHVHVLQTGALTCVATSAVTMLTFTAYHYCDKTRPFSSGEGDGEEARLLPPCATALIVGGLRATLGFTYLIVLMAAIDHETEAFKILVAQIALKHFGTAMAMANQRLAVYTNTAVVSATS